MINSKKLQIFVLVVSLLSLIILSGCNLVDGITGKDEKQTEDTLHPILLNEKWGYINQEGKVVISPQFDEARDISDGFATVRTGTLWGVVQANPPKVILTSTYTTIGNFSDGLAPAQLPGGQYGYIDGTGEFAIAPQFDFAATFSEGLGAVRTDGLWGFVNSSGASTIEPTFSDARLFSDDLAAVETFNGWVYINQIGEVVLTPSFQVSEAGEFVDGIAPVQTNDGWGYINEQGNPVITPKYNSAGNFSNGRAWVSDNGYIGFINTDGDFIIPPQFAEVKPFSEDMSAVRVSNDWFYISKASGKIVINQPFDAAESFLNGIARVRFGSEEDASYGYINKSGDYIWYPSN